jgi:hypothetical protein
MPVIPTLRRPRQEDCRFKDSLGYTVTISKKMKENEWKEGKE